MLFEKKRPKGAHSPILASPALECLQCGDFFIRHFLFHGRKEVFPMSTQQYYDFQNLLVVKFALFVLEISRVKFIMVRIF